MVVVEEGVGAQDLQVEVENQVQNQMVEMETQHLLLLLWASSG